MAATPATAYRAYRSKAVANPDLATWVQVDLARSVSIDAIHLFPASERIYPGRDQYYAGEGFPLRFRIEASEDASFRNPVTIIDFTQSDFPDPADNITQYGAHGVHARYVRLTATRLRAAKGAWDESLAPGAEPKDSPDYTLTLAKMAVLSGGHDVAVGCKVSADEEHGNTGLLGQLTRPARQDGEGIRHDNPHAVTDPATWKPAKYKAQAPKTGVTLDGGLFETAMRNNIEYLLNSYSTDDLLRQFYERTGKIRDFKLTGSQGFWEEDLAGSNAGRFLMGAANTLRWMDHPELRRRLDAVVDGIEECKQPNGYIMAYPEDTIFYSERAAYTRAWLTHGLLEAAYSGNAKALPMLRGYYDWFNRQLFLPEMLRGAVQGGQGMVANTRIGASPAGKPADAQVIQRYYQEEAWLKGLASQEKEQVWQYPYDRPNCYLLTNLEAYLDLYLITGDRLYYNAVLGGWELYRAHWQQAGGSISIIEFEKDPPDSNYLHRKLGELCGNSFWVFLSQRFQLLHPDDERYASEIEKSIYNVGIANQDGGAGLRYHTIMEGKKEKSTHENTCCEGQGTRLLGSLPEHIYSIAPDGLYVHLYEPSTIRWQQGGQAMELTVKTRFPLATEVHGIVKTTAPAQANLRIRVPSWAAGPMKISVNGKAAGAGKPGTYLTLNRQWSDGDVIDFTLPAELQIRRYNGEDQIAGKTRYSIEYGPILLAAAGSSRVDLLVDEEPAAKHLANHLEPVDGSPLHFTVRGNPGQKLMPYWQIAEEEFTCFPTVSARA
ncbi:MAG: beta-L-arabinofuranosidase domain-containing protein [Terracidiphilus sp.]